MGGKTKQTQRTKNNSRPSNSGRSAELFGSSLPSFVGFTALSHCGDIPILPGFTTTEMLPEEIDANIDANYQLVLRKMTKKDPITKVKALQEFADLIGNSEVDTVIAVLPFWPRLYSTLSTDVEHRVREACQQAQFAVATKCGKNIAPYLRQLAPSWITSQYDTYAPAASIASSSFQKSFRPYKQQEVFNFCQNEILDYIVKNLTVFTPTTLSNSKTYTPEECEAKYQRVVICSLKGYALYLSKMTEELLKEASNKNAVMIDNPKFWSFHKHKTASIRGAWFETLAALLQYAPYFIEQHYQQATTSSFQSLDETEPVALPYVWAAILLVTEKCSNWQEYVNLEKALLPKLWKVIKSGGNGNAAVIYPHLLPLVAKLNKNVLGDKLKQFYIDYFQNLNVGLQLRSNQQSRSDMSAIATAYYECLQYIIIQLQQNQLFENEKELADFCVTLVREHLIEVLQWCLTSDTNCGKFIFTSIASLLNHWHANGVDNNVYEVILNYFWTELYGILEQSLETDDNRIERVLDLHFDLVQCFRLGPSGQAKKNVKVKFSTEEDQVDSVDVPKVKQNVVGFNELAYRLCSIYMKKTTESISPVYINNLENLLKTFGNAEFLLRLAGGENLFKLYDKISTWLLIAQLRRENVVDILLILYSYLNAEGKVTLISKLLKFPNDQVQTWVIARLLSYPLCTELDVTKLLVNPNVTKILVKCANDVINGDTTDNINFLHKCFFQNDAGETLIDSGTCEQIVHVIASVLTDDSKLGVLDTCASFLAQIMPVICSDDNKKILQHFMFITFFEFSVNKSISDDLTEDTLWEITTSWQDALSSNDLQLNDILLNKCSKIIETKLSKIENDITIDQIENISEIVSKLILCSIERIENEVDKYGQADTVIDTIFNEKCKQFKGLVDYVEHLCLFLESINGGLTAPTIFGDRPLNDVRMDCTDTVNMLFKLAIFKFNVIFKMTCSIKKKNADITETTVAINNGELGVDDECTEDFCDIEENLIKNWSDNVFDEILDGIYVATLGNCLFNHSSNLPAVTENLIINLSERVNLYLRNISAKNVTQIKEKLFEAAAGKGLFWATSLLTLENIEPYNDEQNGLVLLYEDATAQTIDNELNYINILQTITSKLKVGLLPITQNLFSDSTNILVKSIALRCLIENHLPKAADFNQINDRSIIETSLKLLNELYTKSKADKQYFLYNTDITKSLSEEIILISEIANFYSAAIRSFPKSLETNELDLLRIAVSSWVLTVSKSSENLETTKVAIFVTSIYGLFKELSKFMVGEKIKSSTKVMTDIIEEWEQLFAKDVNLILLKCYIKLVTTQGKNVIGDYFVESLSKTIETIDFKYVFLANRIDSKISLDDLINFALDNLTHDCHAVRMACVCIVKKLSHGLIEKDVVSLNKQQAEIELKNCGQKEENGEKHVLHKFEKYILAHNAAILEYTNEFSFKQLDLDGLSDVPNCVSIPFLLLWECILDICSKTTSELRSTYAAYLNEMKLVQPMLITLFRLMPAEVLRNPDAKHIGQVYFAPLQASQICDSNLLPEHYACHIYLLSLRCLPAVVRKWWYDSNPAQKTFVDKITTSFVSTQLCQDELRGLIDKREKHENMQLTVHTSTREVLATYMIDEARMELIVTLPVNHPLGVVKVDSGKQIGGRLQSRVLVMQLTIFLTHQNGSISDGISLWKRNLDRKFEGVQECYVCYSVIHQDTCQLPKLSCRKCKNKFHGPCLYKWFSTSNKSTCPICRNIF